MSKNFELLHQAGIGLGAVPATTGEAGAVEGKNQELTAAAEQVIATGPGVREEALKLVQRLFLSQGHAAPRAVMFAAVDAKNGCSRLCALIAKLLAESVSGSVCLVEGNFRTPSLAEVLGVPSRLGLADSLRVDGPIRRFTKQAGRENLWLLSAGSQARDSASLLNCDQMRERIAELREEFDYLLIEAPSLSAYADGIVFGRLTDGIVLVLEANETRREAALRVVENVRALNIPVLGAVLNNRTFPIPRTLYKRL